jgi:sporulation integral membrane protein YtvI
MTINKMNHKTKFLIIIILSVTGVYFGFQYILPLFTPFILAYFIAWILLPVVRFLNNKLHVPKVIGSIVSLMVLGTAVIAAMCYLCDMFLKQLTFFIKNVPVYLAILSGHIDNLCSSCDDLFGTKLGTVRELFDSNMDNVIILIRTDVMPSLTSQSLRFAIGLLGAVGVIIFTMVSIILILKEEAEYKNAFKRSVFYPDIHKITSKLSETGIAYLRAQAIMMVFVAIWITAGLLLIKNDYALLLGIGIGIFDAFPVLGSGLILVPWSILSILNKDLFSAAVLITLYFGCQIIRQVLEPRLLGNRIGIKPIFTLMSMYVGARLFGVPGFFLGPIGLVTIMTIVKETEEEIIF